MTRLPRVALLLCTVAVVAGHVPAVSADAEALIRTQVTGDSRAEITLTAPLTLHLDRAFSSDNAGAVAIRNAKQELLVVAVLDRRVHQSASSAPQAFVLPYRKVDLSEGLILAPGRYTFFLSGGRSTISIPANRHIALQPRPTREFQARKTTFVPGSAVTGQERRLGVKRDVAADIVVSFAALAIEDHVVSNQAVCLVPVGNRCEVSPDGGSAYQQQNIAPAVGRNYLTMFSNAVSGDLHPTGDLETVAAFRGTTDIVYGTAVSILVRGGL